MPSIKDVAKLADVSTSTVSKVIHKYPSISEETKEKVNAAINALDYIPNMAAANLSRKSFNKIALILNVNNAIQAIDELNMKYLFGAFQRAHDESLIETVVIFSNMIANKTEVELTNYFRSQNINGIIFYGMTKYDTIYLNIINSGSFSCVIVDAPIVNDFTSSVMIDHFTGQYDVANQTIPEECRNILYLAGNNNGYITDMRLDAMKKLCEDRNITMKYHFANFSEHEAYTFVSKNHTYDAYICASDLMAVGTLKALQKFNISKPISGFDGINLMGYVASNILTVKQDFMKISYLAVCELEKLLHGAKGRQVKLDYSILKVQYDDVSY